METTKKPKLSLTDFTPRNLALKIEQERQEKERLIGLVHKCISESKGLGCVIPEPYVKLIFLEKSLLARGFELMPFHHTEEIKKKSIINFTDRLPSSFCPDVPEAWDFDLLLNEEQKVEFYADVIFRRNVTELLTEMIISSGERHFRQHRQREQDTEDSAKKNNKYLTRLTLRDIMVALSKRNGNNKYVTKSFRKICLYQILVETVASILATLRKNGWSVDVHFEPTAAKYFVIRWSFVSDDP